MFNQFVFLFFFCKSICVVAMDYEEGERGDDMTKHNF